MKYVTVCFPNSRKEYVYKTNLNLIVGAVYNIVADGNYTYSSPVRIVKNDSAAPAKIEIREITEANCIKAERKHKNCFKKVIFNEEKRTTCVIWNDGTRTVLKCADGDVFDREKALMAAYMKKCHENRGYFNDYIAKVLEDAIEQ